MSTALNPLKVGSVRPRRCPPETTTGRVLTKHSNPYDRTTLSLTFTSKDAAALRETVSGIRLKDGKLPTMSILARRALAVYLDWLPSVLESEIATLNRMTTPVPAPRKRTTTA